MGRTGDRHLLEAMVTLPLVIVALFAWTAWQEPGFAIAFVLGMAGAAVLALIGLGGLASVRRGEGP